MKSSYLFKILKINIFLLAIFFIMPIISLAGGSKDDESLSISLEQNKYIYGDVNACQATPKELNQITFKGVKKISGYNVCYWKQEVADKDFKGYFSQTISCQDSSMETYYVSFSGSSENYKGVGCRKLITQNNNPTGGPSGTGSGSGNSYINEVCKTEGMTKAMSIVGYIIYALKIIGPLMIIIFGIIDYVKVILSNDENALKKATTALIRRFVASIVTFFIPTIILVIVDIVDASNLIDKNNSDFGSCTRCVLDPFNSCGKK